LAANEQQDVGRELKPGAHEYERALESLFLIY
jgi:hypothetical protein